MNLTDKLIEQLEAEISERRELIAKLKGSREKEPQTTTPSAAPQLVAKATKAKSRSWTPERLKKFQATMKARKAQKTKAA